MSAEEVSEIVVLRRLLDDKKGVCESSRTDSGFISGEISEEITDSGASFDEHQVHDRPAAIPEERPDDEEKPHEPMILDSGVCLSDSFSKIVIKERRPQGLNDLNSPRTKSQTPVDSVRPSKIKPSAEVPWKAYYEQDEEGDTHLHVAISHGFLEVALALIRAVPHPRLLDTPNDDGKTAMHLAAESGQWRVVRWLRVAGAAPCPRGGPRGDSPLHAAAEADDARTIWALAEPVLAQEKEQLGLSYQGQVYRSCDLDQWNLLGQSCVHVAAALGNLDALKQLVRYGANVNAKEGCTGYTALHLAVRAASEETVRFLVDCEHVDVDRLSYGGKDALEVNRSASMEIRRALKGRGLPSPCTSDDEFDSDSGDEMNFDTTHVFSAQMVNASA
ncbi:unnamed protein product [Phyllotreta striolata]|uniref:NF-kappa-B inhibitor cactus n=1 Tax=Phyllotreta striolata TaxID=444603 RepID=A0A9N9TWH7_PHYSR|nr:unnamed protein product [Phyllotreta striolata]